MIVLDSTAKSLQILLAGAITTNQLVFTASYADYIASPAAFTPGANDGVTNNATAVTLVAAPGASTQRQVKRINVYNADSAQATVTIRLNNGGTLRTMLTVALQTGERIEYEDGEGFQVFTVTGAIKVTAVASTVEPGYIDGLRLVWVSGTSLTVTSGSAYIPSVGANVMLPANDLNPGLVLSASTWYHVYLYLNSGVPDVEIVTTAPSATYNGWARTKTGDTTRRYLGSVRTDSGGNLIQFKVDTLNTQRYLTNNASQRILSSGTSSVRTTVSASNFVPVTATHSIIQCANTDTAIFFNLSQPEAAASSVVGIAPNSPGSIITFPLSDSQQIDYFFSTPPTGAAFIDVLGFAVAR